MENNGFNDVKVTIRTPTSENPGFPRLAPVEDTTPEVLVGFLQISFEIGERNDNLFRDRDLLRNLLNRSLGDLELKRNPKISTSITPEKNLSTTEACPICRETILEELISPLKCNHIFHTVCIEEWVKYKPECPVCRASIPIKME